MIPRLRSPFLTAYFTAVCLSSCSESTAGATPASGPSGSVSSTPAARSNGTGPAEPALQNRTLREDQARLLEMAFRTASAIPSHPHIKVRSKAREDVVVTCLELDQPERALGYAEQIENWRRGTALADLAFYRVRQGDAGGVNTHLEEAREILGTTEDWRHDRLRVKIARVHAWLGELDQARTLSAGVIDSEAGKIDAVLAMRMEPEAFDDQMDALGAVVTSAGFDRLHNALGTYVELFDRFYDDGARRRGIWEAIQTGWEHLPLEIRIRITVRLTEIALEHDDRAGALELVETAQALLDEATWKPEDRIPMACLLAELRFGAGDEETARANLNVEVERYERGREGIHSIWRGRALRPLAEAHHAMGDTPAALAFYQAAVAEALVNPNSKPRAEDLSAICLSLAAHGIEPDAGLWDDLRYANELLGPPW